jgi:hypothetical protein
MTKTPGQIQSLKHEKRLAAKHAGGQRAAGSGSFWSRKGDVRSTLFVIEHKYTAAKKSISVKVEWLNTIRNIGLMEGRIPVLAFHLGGQNYVVLSEDDFDELTERAYGLAGSGEV